MPFGVRVKATSSDENYKKMLFERKKKKNGREIGTKCG